jgi:hypothetical protein
MSLAGESLATPVLKSLIPQNALQGSLLLVHSCRLLMHWVGRTSQHACTCGTSANWLRASSFRAAALLHCLPVQIA